MYDLQQQTTVMLSNLPERIFVVRYEAVMYEILRLIIKFYSYDQYQVHHLSQSPLIPLSLQMWNAIVRYLIIKLHILLYTVDDESYIICIVRICVGI
jgi:hypothetical protein